MRKVLTIALNALRLTVRDRKALIMILAAPLIAIGILGTALSGMMGGSAQINPYDVLVISEDAPAKPPLPAGAPPEAAAGLQEFHFGQMLIEQVLDNEEVRQVITSRPVTDLAQARADVADGKAAALIHVPANFSRDILSGQKAEVAVLTDPGSPTGAAIVNQVVRTFTDNITYGRMNAVLTGEQTQSPLVTPEIAEVTAGAREVSAMQYYAAAMAIMFMVMTAVGRARSLLEERENGTLSRILTSPTGKGTFLAGQILGTVIVLMGQFGVLALGTRFLFGVNWGSVTATILLGTAFSLAAAGVGTAIAGLVKDPKAADASTGLIGMIFAALSGSMFPIYFFPETMRNIAKAIPNYWALTGFIDQMGGADFAKVWLPVSILTGIGLATGALGSWRLATK